MSKFGTALAAAIEASGLTQEQVAESASVSQETISRIVTGDTAEPKTSTWSKLAAVFGLTGDELLRGDTPKSRTETVIDRSEADAPSPSEDDPFKQTLWHAVDRAKHTPEDYENVRKALAEIPRKMKQHADPVTLAREWLDATARLRIAGIPFSSIALAAELTGQRKLDAVQRAVLDERTKAMNDDAARELRKLTHPEESKPGKKR